MMATNDPTSPNLLYSNRMDGWRLVGAMFWPRR